MWSLSTLRYSTIILPLARLKSFHKTSATSSNSIWHGISKTNRHFNTKPITAKKRLCFTILRKLLTGSENLVTYEQKFTIIALIRIFIDELQIQSIKVCSKHFIQRVYTTSANDSTTTENTEFSLWIEYKIIRTKKDQESTGTCK